MVHRHHAKKREGQNERIRAKVEEHRGPLASVDTEMIIWVAPRPRPRPSSSLHTTEEVKKPFRAYGKAKKEHRRAIAE